MIIFDKMENIGLYCEKHPQLGQVLAFAEDFARSEKADGTYEIDGKKVFAMIQSYTTKDENAQMLFEAHKKYMDVQYLVEGTEKIRCAPLHTLTLREERYSQGGDVAFYQGCATGDFILTAGTFLLLEPEDAHLPGLRVDKDTAVRKIVFKVQVGAAD